MTTALSLTLRSPTDRDPAFRLPASPLRSLLAAHHLSLLVAAILGGWASDALLKKQLGRDRVDGYRVDQLCVALGTHIAVVYVDDYFSALDGRTQ